MMREKTTVALIGGVISTLYFMTPFINPSYWLYHWILRFGGLLGFFLLGTLGKTKNDGTPILAFMMVASHYTIIFVAELTIGYLSFIHIEIVETIKNNILITLLGWPFLFAWIAAIFIGAYYSRRWNLYE